MSVVYPLWVIQCDSCGAVGTLWEKPGTGCSYVEYCPSCGRGPTGVTTERVEDKSEHEAAFRSDHQQSLAELGPDMEGA